MLLNLGRVGQGAALSGPRVSYSPEAMALFARMTTQPDATRKGHINALIVALKAAGIWSKLDALFLLAAHTAQAARLNIVQDAYNLVPVNSPTFTTDRGYVADGTTSKLTSTFNPSSAPPPKYTVDSAFVFGWSRTAAANNGPFLIAPTGTNMFMIVRNASNGFNSRLNSNVNSGAAGVLDGSGGFVLSRTAVGTVNAYRNGSSLGALTSPTGGALPNSTFGILSTGGGGATVEGAAIGWGGGLTADEVSAFHGAMNAYMTAVGAA